MVGLEFAVFSKSASCGVMPYMLNAATPVCAVSSTVISSGGCSCPDNCRNLIASRDNIALSNSTSSTEKECVWYDCLSFLHCQQSFNTPSTITMNNLVFRPLIKS